MAENQARAPRMRSTRHAVEKAIERSKTYEGTWESVRKGASQ